MKTIIMAIAILLIANTGTFAQTHKHHHAKASSATKYTCTMHPEVVMNKPGKCPKCGMDLVKMKPMKKGMKMKGDMKDMKM